MIAMRVIHNGEPLCIAGAEDLAVLSTIVSAVGNLGPLTKRERDEPLEIVLSVSGLTARADGHDEHLEWVGQKTLRPGDKIELELLDISKADPPNLTKPHLSKEHREREHYEHAKGIYLALRAKFERES